jgi:nucleoside-diphosphate-sugar epimerase
MSFVGRTVLVTGANGFVGARVVQQLASQGAEVRALVRSGLVARPVHRQTLVRGDVTDRASLDAAIRDCDVVFHCAWGGTTLEEGRRINVTGTSNVVQAAAAAGVRRVVHVSTMAVHGPRTPDVLDEECPLCFQGDAYSVSKAEGEVAAFQDGARHGIEVVAVRPTIVYGPRSPLWVLAYFERVKSEQVLLVGGGVGIANLVYVDDLVDAMQAAAETPGISGHAFLVSGAPATWREYLAHFARMCAKPPPRSIGVARARIEASLARVYCTLTQRPRRVQGIDVQHMTYRTRVSTDKAARLLGWVPRFDLDAGMAACEEWLRAIGRLPPRRSQAAAPPIAVASAVR